MDNPSEDILFVATRRTIISAIKDIRSTNKYLTSRNFLSMLTPLKGSKILLTTNSEELKRNYPIYGTFENFLEKNGYVRTTKEEIEAGISGPKDQAGLSRYNF